MREIKFNDLVKIFGACYATDNVGRYMATELYDYHLLRKQGVELNEEQVRRMGQLQNDPNNFVFAMPLDDSEWNKVPPRTLKHEDTGPLKSETGQYKVKCPMGEFDLNPGDFLVLRTNRKDDINSIEVMKKEQFKAGYRKSENV